MIDPSELQSSIFAKLQAINSLVDFIGDVGEIRAYGDES